MDEPIFEVIAEDTKENYTKFAITPLEQGYGSTLGNSLRRVLLTALPGAVATSAKISGVKHQFSSLKGMKEDVVEFVLNLKKVRFSYDGNKPVKGTISVSGPGEVRAKDIQVESFVKIGNPELVLANLNKDSKLEVKLEIESGTGYSPADDRKTGEIGMIPLDASFSPIQRVDYTVEETRVGRLTNYDKLILEVWTDGTIDAKDALVKASSILSRYFNQIVTPATVEKKIEKTEEGLGQTGRLSVEEIGLPTRVANALIKAGYESVEELMNAKRSDLVRVRNLGEKSVKIVDAALSERNLKLPE